MNYKSEKSYMKSLSESLYNDFLDSRRGIEIIQRIESVPEEEAIDLVTKEVLFYYNEELSNISKKRKALFEDFVRFFSYKDIKNNTIQE